MKDIDIFYFNDLGDYDEYNPAYYLDRDNASILIYYIAQSPYIESIDSLSKKIVGNHKDILDGLVNIKALSIKNNKYKVNFPVFYENDVKLIVNEVKPFLNDILNNIKVILKDFNYNKEELYHILCNNTFDNYSLRYLMYKYLITNMKINPGYRNYLIIGYEKSDFINDYSNKLLCSNNKYETNNIVFNSFGDTDGARLDFYRYFRLKEQGKYPFNDINEYMKIINDDRDTLNKNINLAINGNGDKNTIELLNKLGYMKGNKVSVPILINNSYYYFGFMIMNSIIDIIKEIFENIRLLDITPNRNEVLIMDTFNEVWHIIFGLINEKLVKENIVSTPKSLPGEGRYLKCIYRSDLFNKDDLKVYGDSLYDEGYRLVYLKDNYYYLGSYSKEIEGFMYELIGNDPFTEPDKFISTKDLMKKLLKLNNDDEVFIYKVDGTLVDSLKNNK